MRRILLALLFLAVGVCSANATAFNACSNWGTPDDESPAFGVTVCGTAAAAPASVCQGAFSDDGCAAAPAPSTAYFIASTPANAFATGGYFNSITGTATNYMATDCGASGAGPCRPPWKVGGVDYHIGPYTAEGSLLDPVASPPTGCTASIKANGGGLLTCTGGTFAGTIQHYNFGPSFGHGCTALALGTVTAASVLIDDDLWINDGNCNYIDSAPPANSFAYMIGGNLTVPVTISNTSFDGMGGTYRDAVGSCASPNASCNPWQAFSIQSPLLTLKYDSVNHFAGRPINFPVAAGDSYTMQFSYIEGATYSANNGHGEMLVPNIRDGSQGTFLIDHNVIVQRWDTAQIGEAPIFFSASYAVSYSGGITVQNNVDINPSIGKSTITNTTTFTYCIGGDDTCTTPGSTAWLHTVSGGATVGPGLEANCNQNYTFTVSAVSGTGFTVTGTPGGTLAVGTTFSLGGQALYITAAAAGGGAGSYTANKTITGSPGTATVSTDIWFVKQLSGSGGSGPNAYLASFTFEGGGYWAPETLTNLSCSTVNGNGSQAFGGAAFFDMSTVDPSLSSAVTANYLDTTLKNGAANAQAIYTVGGSSQNLTSASISTTLGVVTLTTSSSVFLPGHTYIYASDYCTNGASLLGCPYVTTTATGTSFVLTYGGSITSGPETMQAIEPTVCATSGVTAFSGNVDMAAYNSSANVNAWSGSLGGSPPQYQVGCF